MIMFTPFVKYMMKRGLNDQRSPSRINSDGLQSVAIIASANPDQHLRKAQQFHKELKGRGIRNVDLYVAFDSKKAIESANLSQGFPFSKKSFNWFGKFTDVELKKRISSDYNLLIDLSEGKYFCADLLIAKTNASWKAGRKMPGREYLLDFMIDAKDKDLATLIHQIEHYLQIFNKPHAA